LDFDIDLNFQEKKSHQTQQAHFINTTFILYID